MRGVDFNGFLAITGKQDLISLRRQNGLRHLANAIVVVGEQDRFGAAAYRQILENGGAKLACLSGFIDRKKDSKRAPQAGLAFYLNRPIMLFDNTINSSKAQAGPLPGPFSGEERLEDPLS